MSQKLVRIQQKKDSTADWNNSDLFLFDGEIGVDQTTGQIKIGKKISDEEFASWSDLSYITSASENAYKENCFSFGQGSIAGQKGYYIGAIDTLNKWIYLVKGTEKPTSIPMGSNKIPEGGTLLPLNNTSFSVGDEFSIINDSYYYFCGKIEKIDITNNRIKYNVNLPFTTISYSADFDDQVFFVTNKPYEGEVNLIDNAMAIGQTAKANGKGSFACGRETMAAGGGAFAAGRKTKAGYIGTASGLNASAIGDCSFATNSNTVAIGNSSAAFGAGTTSSGLASFSCGSGTIAAEVGSLATGINTVSDGIASISLGKNTKAHGVVALASGASTIANGDYSFSANSSTIADGESSTSFGFNTHAMGKSSFVCGNSSISSAINSFAANSYTTSGGESSAAFGSGTASKGLASFSCGVSTVSEGTGALATGVNTLAKVDASSAFGKDSQALGVASFVSGISTTSEGITSFASGSNNSAIGDFSFAANSYTKTRGESSAAFGFNTRSNGAKSFATGISTTANGEAMIVGGKFNATIDNKIVVYGNGNDGTNRKDAYTLDWDGNAYYAGIIETLGIKLPTYNITLSSNNINSSPISNYYYYDLTTTSLNRKFLNPNHYNLIINLKSLDITSTTSIDAYIEMKNQYEYAELIGATYDTKNIILITGDRPTQDIDIEVTVIKK